MEYRILELFSGIGGMHQAYKSTKFKGKVVAAVDINPVANSVYTFNHPGTPIWNKNIERLKAETVQQLNVNMILLSPPCQPHTRVGNQRDIYDPRSDALSHITTLLPECSTVEYVLMENVKGFENSQARAQFIHALELAGFYWREFLLSPHQLGVSNTRHRYYCLARKIVDFNFLGSHLWTKLPDNVQNLICNATVEDVLEDISEVLGDFRVPAKALEKYWSVFDIVTAESCNTICFTKAYTHYHEGTGSIYGSSSSTDVKRICTQLKLLNDSPNKGSDCVHEQKYKLLQNLELRFFTPREVARLMSFPETFQFPPHITTRQQYRLLGNSINIKVVGELITLLCR